MLRRNGSVDITNSKRWNGSAWQDCEFVRRWNGSAWVDVWTGRHFAPFRSDANVTSTAQNGVWNSYAPGNSNFIAGASLLLVPADFTAPLTLTVDWEGWISGDAQITIGSFDSMNNLVSGLRYSYFPRRTETVNVDYDKNGVRLGVVTGAQTFTGYSASCNVYSIKINGVNIPIR